MISKYELGFTPTALKQWKSLDNSAKQVFKKALLKRLSQPVVASAKLNFHDSPIDCYKIKLRTHGYRLVYTILEDKMIVAVLTIDRRDKVYNNLAEIASSFSVSQSRISTENK